MWTSAPTVRRGSRPLPLQRFWDGGLTGTVGGGAEGGPSGGLEEAGECDGGGGGEGGGAGGAEVDTVATGACAPPGKKVW